MAKSIVTSDDGRTFQTDDPVVSPSDFAAGADLMHPTTDRGTPEGAITGSPGDMYHRTNGGAGTSLYVKETGTATNTGWVGK